MSHAPLHSSDEGRQGAGHKLCYYFTLSGLEVCFCTKFGTFWKQFSTKYGSFWHADFGVDPKLVETAPLLHRVTDVPFLPKMEQEPKLVETVFYQFWHISD